MENIIYNIKKKAKLKAYEIARQSYLKNSICNIGKIVEEDDKIICYVNQKAVDRYKGNKPIYELRLDGMYQVTDSSKEIVEKFKLNKPVYYIFDGIKFNRAVKISSLWANVEFRNCTFDKNIGIVWGEKIIFENNKYSDHYPIYFYGDCFLTADRVKEIVFINEKIFNSHPIHPTRFGMKIDSQIIKFINSKVETSYQGAIDLKAKVTKIDNSTLSAKEVYIDSLSIEFTDSFITARNGAMIENAICDFSGNVEAPIVFYNGTDLANKDEETHKVDAEEANLKEGRKRLIEQLHNLSDYCQQLNNDKVENIKDNLDNQTIAKVLKKYKK